MTLATLWPGNCFRSWLAWCWPPCSPGPTYTFPASPAVRTRVVSVADPTVYFANALRAALVSHGIAVGGAAIDIHDLANPPARSEPPLVAYDSPPLAMLATILTLALVVQDQTPLRAAPQDSATKQATLYQVDRKIGTAKKLPMDDSYLLDSLAYLQGANYVYKNRLNRIR